ECTSVLTSVLVIQYSHRLISAAVEEHLFGRGNETSCHPPARWLPLYRPRSFACPARPCARPRSTSEQIGRRLFHNRQGPSLLLRARRVAPAVSLFGSQESGQDPNRQNSRRRSFARPSVCARESHRRPQFRDTQPCSLLPSNRPRDHPSRYLPPALSHHQQTCAPDLCVQKMVTLSTLLGRHRPGSVSFPEATPRCVLHRAVF